MSPASSTPTDLDPQRRREVPRQAWSVGIATGSYGVSFGALSVAAGLSIWQTIALSAVMFTGGSQFAFVGIIATGLGAAPSAIATAGMLGIRNGLYALQNARYLRAPGWRRLAAAHLTIDESTAVGVGQAEPAAQRIGFWHTGIAVYVFWNAATAIGAVIGDRLGNPSQYGLDAAAAAAFCALLWPRLRSGDAQATAVIAIFIALVTSPFLPAGVPVLCAALAAVVVGLHQAGRHEAPLAPDPGSDPLP